MIEINDKTCAYCDDCRASLLKEIKEELEGFVTARFIIDEGINSILTINLDKYWKSKEVNK